MPPDREPSRGNDPPVIARAPASQPGPPFRGNPTSIVGDLDRATEAALAAMPSLTGRGADDARRALEQSVARYLAALGLTDLARRYLALRAGQPHPVSS